MLNWMRFQELKKSFGWCSVRCHKEFAFLSHMARSFPQMFLHLFLATRMQVMLLGCHIPGGPVRKT